MFISCTDKKWTKEAADGSAPRDPPAAVRILRCEREQRLVNRDAIATKVGRNGCGSILFVAVGQGLIWNSIWQIKFI